MSNGIPTLPKLIRTTRRLRRDLDSLLKKYPERHLELGARIIDRIMSNSWCRMGELQTGYSQQQIEAIVWRDNATDYVQELQAYFSSRMAKPVFEELPFIGQQNTACELIWLLDQQYAALDRIHQASRTVGGAKRTGAATLDDKLRKKVQEAVNKRGLTAVAEECRLGLVWWPGTGSNRRRQPFQGCALPLSYLAIREGVTGGVFPL